MTSGVFNMCTQAEQVGGGDGGVGGKGGWGTSHLERMLVWGRGLNLCDNACMSGDRRNIPVATMLAVASMANML